MWGQASRLRRELSRGVGDYRLINGPLVQQHPEDLVADQSRQHLGVGGDIHGEERALAGEHSPGHQEVDVGMPVEQVPRTLQTRHRARDSRAAPGGGLQQ